MSKPSQSQLTMEHWGSLSLLFKSCCLKQAREFLTFHCFNNTLCVTSKDSNSKWKFACAHDWEPDYSFVCVCARLCVYVWVIDSSYVFQPSRYWGEWQGVKLKLHPLSERHIPHLCSSSAGLPIKIQSGVCVCACSKPWGYLSRLSAKQYSFEIWQLQIAHIMTAHGQLAPQSHKLNTIPPPCLPWPCHLLPPSSPALLPYLFIHFLLEGKGLNGHDSFGCLIKIYNSSLLQRIFASVESDLGTFAFKLESQEGNTLGGPMCVKMEGILLLKQNGHSCPVFLSQCDMFKIIQGHWVAKQLKTPSCNGKLSPNSSLCSVGNV